MNNKLLIGLGVLVAGFLITSTTTRAQDLEQRFKLFAGTPNGLSISGGMLRFNAPVQIVNQSAFDVTIRNLFVNISYQDTAGNWQDLFYQPNGISQVTFKRGTTTNLNNIPLQMPLTNAFTLVQMATGRLSSQLKVTTRFEVSGIALAPIEALIDTRSYIQPLIAVLQRFGLIRNSQITGLDKLELTGLGYSSNNFHYRNIKDASKYEHLIPKASGKEVTIRKSGGSAYDTIEDMAMIVGQTLEQTKELAQVLKGESKEQSVRNVYTWLHDHIQYAKDKDGVEQLREPAASFANREKGIDCDCFSIFASSLLTNLGIDHYIEMCQIHPNPWFVHVYVVVPKQPGLSLDKRENYWVVDPCLHSFDELAKNVTIKYSKKMITTRLSGLDCPACESHNNKADFGKSANVKPAQFLTKEQLNQLELKAIEPLRQNLILTRQQAIADPSKVALIYHPGNLIKAIDYALKNWNDADKRAAALDILAQQDEAITNRPMINGLMGVGAFNGLNGALDPSYQYPLLGLDENNTLYVEGLGGLFKSVKKATNSVGNFVKNNANAAVNSLKQAGKASGAAISQAANFVVTKAADAGKFVAQNAMKVLPLAIVARTAYRGLVALNFRGYANKLATAISTTQGEKKLRDFWTGNFVGGNWGDLISAINTGKTKRPLMNGVDGLGEPVTVAASVTAATPLIVKITQVINDALKLAEQGKKITNTVQQAQQVVQQVQNTASTVQSFIPSRNQNPNSPAVQNQIVIPSIDPNISARQNPEQYNQPQQQVTEQAAVQTAGKDSSGWLIGAGLAALVAVFALANGTEERKPLKGVPELAI